MAGASGFLTLIQRRPAGAIRAVAPLRDDALEAHGACVAEHRLAIGAVEMFGQPNSVAGLAQKAREGTQQTNIPACVPDHRCRQRKALQPSKTGDELAIWRQT
jgi:hypothetical protein